MKRLIHKYSKLISNCIVIDNFFSLPNADDPWPPPVFVNWKKALLPLLDHFMVPEGMSNYYHHLSSHFTILWSIVPWLYSKHIWPQRGRRIKITRQNSMSRMSLKAQKLDFHTWKWNFWVEPPGHVTPLQNFPSKHFQASDGQSTKTQIIGGDNHASLQCVEELCFYINKKSVSFSIMSPSIRARENTLEMEYWYALMKDMPCHIKY
jgi:hypothetical protein